MYVRFFASAVVIERISHEWVTAAAKRAKSTVMCVAIDQGGPEFGDARDRARDGHRRGLRQARPGRGRAGSRARREQNPVAESATDRLNHVAGPGGAP